MVSSDKAVWVVVAFVALLVLAPATITIVLLIFWRPDRGPAKTHGFPIVPADHDSPA